MDNVQISLRIAFAILYVFSCFTLTNCDKSAECSSLLLRIKSCLSESVEIDGCGGNYRNNALMCAERVAKSVQSCDNKIVKRMLDHTIEMYKWSDQIICDENFGEKFDTKAGCWKNASELASNLADISIPFLNENGCRMKLLFLLIRYKDYCNGYLTEYFQQLYNKSPCGGLPISTDNSAEEINECYKSYEAAPKCLYDHGRSIPRCSTEKQPMQECLESVDASSCTLLPFQQMTEDMIRRYEASVDIVCKKEELKHDIVSSNCWQAVLNNNVIKEGIFNTLFSDTECDAMKYLLEMNVAKIDHHCIEIVERMDHELEERLPCGNGSGRNCNYLITFIFMMIFLML